MSKVHSVEHLAQSSDTPRALPIEKAHATHTKQGGSPGLAPSSFALWSLLLPGKLAAFRHELLLARRHVQHQIQTDVWFEVWYFNGDTMLKWYFDFDRWDIHGKTAIRRAYH